MKSIEEQAEELKGIIDRERVFRGEKKKELAHRIGSTPSSYNAFMTPGRYPTLYTFINYANALGLRLELVPVEKEQTHAP